MRKIFSIITMAALSMIVLSSCGSSKPVTTSASLNEEEIEVKKTKSEKMAEEKPAMRDFGEGTNFNQSFAKTFAEGQARAAFARKLQTMVQTASRESADGAMKAHSNGTDSSLGTDQGFLSNAFAQQVAEGAVSGLVVINTDTFKKRDGQYHVYVCVEYMGNIEALASSLANQAKKVVEQQVSEEERLKMKFEYEQFKNSIQDQLERLRGNY